MKELLQKPFYKIETENQENFWKQTLFISLSLSFSDLSLSLSLFLSLSLSLSLSISLYIYISISLALCKSSLQLNHHFLWQRGHYYSGKQVHTDNLMVMKSPLSVS